MEDPGWQVVQVVDIATFKPIPPQHELLDFLSYDPETGLVTYTKTRSNRAPAGTVTNGPQIKINGLRYEISRVIWMMVTGEDPVVIVDHHDGDHDNNRWGNLRLATVCQNNANSRVAVQSSTRTKGVYAKHYKSGTVYTAAIKVGGKQHYLGQFDTLREAAAAYNAAAEKHHGEFSITRRPAPQQKTR